MLPTSIWSRDWVLVLNCQTFISEEQCFSNSSSHISLPHRYHRRFILDSSSVAGRLTQTRLTILSCCTVSELAFSSYPKWLSIKGTSTSVRGIKPFVLADLDNTQILAIPRWLCHVCLLALMTNTSNNFCKNVLPSAKGNGFSNIWKCSEELLRLSSE